MARTGTKQIPPLILWIISQYKGDGGNKARKDLKDSDKAARELNATIKDIFKQIAEFEIGKKVFEFFKDSVDASIRANREMANAKNMAANAGFGWDQVGGKIEAYSKKMIRLGIDDEDTALSVTKLLGITKDLNKAFDLNAVAADLAANKGISLEEATSAVAGIMAGNTRILKQYGIELRTGATAQEALKALMDRTKGSAEAMATPLDRLKITVGNLQEAIGDKLNPTIDDLAATMADFSDNGGADAFVAAIEWIVKAFKWLSSVIAFFEVGLVGTIDNMINSGKVVGGFFSALWTSISNPAKAKEAWNNFSKLNAQIQQSFKVNEDMADLAWKNLFTQEFVPKPEPRKNPKVTPGGGGNYSGEGSKKTPYDQAKEEYEATVQQDDMTIAEQLAFWKKHVGIVKKSIDEERDYKIKTATLENSLRKKNLDDAIKEVELQAKLNDQKVDEEIKAYRNILNTHKMNADERKEIDDKIAILEKEKLQERIKDIQDRVSLGKSTVQGQIEEYEALLKIAKTEKERTAIEQVLYQLHQSLSAQSKEAFDHQVNMGQLTEEQQIAELRRMREIASAQVDKDKAKKDEMAIDEQILQLQQKILDRDKARLQRDNKPKLQDLDGQIAELENLKELAGLQADDYQAKSDQLEIEREIVALKVKKIGLQVTELEGEKALIVAALAAKKISAEKADIDIKAIEAEIASLNLEQKQLLQGLDFQIKQFGAQLHNEMRDNLSSAIQQGIEEGKPAAVSFAEYMANKLKKRLYDTLADSILNGFFGKSLEGILGNVFSSITSNATNGSGGAGALAGSASGGGNNPSGGFGKFMQDILKNKFAQFGLGALAGGGGIGSLLGSGLGMLIPGLGSLTGGLLGGLLDGLFGGNQLQKLTVQANSGDFQIDFATANFKKVTLPTSYIGKDIPSFNSTATVYNLNVNVEAKGSIVAQRDLNATIKSAANEAIAESKADDSKWKPVQTKNIK